MRHTENKFELPFIVVSKVVIKDEKKEIVNEKDSIKISATVFTID